ncbi:MAG: hypothetical protein Q3M24_02550 [Candidatus Electrothrix aestuarii]|uniref:Uncharacterized protein n=1 Tax=Candidatus Electrothrix aestuarii TaxID=3062594 RepID=A0AAU8LWR6_9BACT|nr:hypothetical protein [Candidatus Electrothrix aestuarii]
MEMAVMYTIQISPFSIVPLSGAPKKESKSMMVMEIIDVPVNAL